MVILRPLACQALRAIFGDQTTKLMQRNLGPLSEVASILASVEIEIAKNEWRLMPFFLLDNCDAQYVLRRLDTRQELHQLWEATEEQQKAKIMAERVNGIATMLTKFSNNTEKHWAAIPYEADSIHGTTLIRDVFAKIPAEFKPLFKTIRLDFLSREMLEFCPIKLGQKMLSDHTVAPSTLSGKFLLGINFGRFHKNLDFLSDIITNGQQWHHIAPTKWKPNPSFWSRNPHQAEFRLTKYFHELDEKLKFVQLEKDFGQVQSLTFMYLDKHKIRPAIRLAANHVALQCIFSEELVNLGNYFVMTNYSLFD